MRGTGTVADNGVYGATIGVGGEGTVVGEIWSAQVKEAGGRGCPDLKALGRECCDDRSSSFGAGINAFGILTPLSFSRGPFAGGVTGGSSNIESNTRFAPVLGLGTSIVANEHFGV